MSKLPSTPKYSANKARRYPPLALIGVAVFLVATVLPSALNFAQSNPSQTLEYAPVPSKGSEARMGGNLSSLGLGSTGGLVARGEESDEMGALPGGAGARPSTKRCVGNPPRQTEDPLSPPCVAYFEGNNFGATHAGVTGGEVRVLLYLSGYSAGNRCERFLDVGRDPPEQAYIDSPLATYQRYFNDRFQTFGRFVHFFLQLGKCNDYSVEARRADAVEAYERVKPFAAISFATEGNQQAYVETLANRNVVTFLGSKTPNAPQSFFTRYPGLMYGFNPTIEHYSDLFSGYVCSKVVPFRVSFSGNALDADQPRKLGQLHTDDPRFPEIVSISRLIAEAVTRCGGRIEITRTFSNGYADLIGGDRQEAAQNMATFKREGVTTLLWTGGFDFRQTEAAAAVDYRPEIVALGITGLDTNYLGFYQERTVWRNAWVVTGSTFVETEKGQLCYQILKEADPRWDEVQSRQTACSFFYPSIRQLFTGIQVAGPRLTPNSMDRGFHAIPNVPSSHPSVPACFYERSDYTCVKDAVPQWWDPSGPAEHPTSGNQAGCWRAPERGKRYLAGAWPREDVPSRRSPNDPCNNRFS